LIPICLSSRQGAHVSMRAWHRLLSQAREGWVVRGQVVKSIREGGKAPRWEAGMQVEDSLRAGRLQAQLMR
jgi:hypothetical protein